MGSKSSSIIGHSYKPMGYLLLFCIKIKNNMVNTKDYMVEMLSN